MSDAVKNYLKNFKKQEQSKQKQKGEIPSVLLKWVVMDGVLHPNWTEGLNTVLDNERQFSMANAGRVPISSKWKRSVNVSIKCDSLLKIDVFMYVSVRQN